MCTFSHSFALLPSSELWAASNFLYLSGAGGAHPMSVGFGTRNKNIINPVKPIIIPGTMKLRPQSDSTNLAAIKLPKILPNDV